MEGNIERRTYERHEIDFIIQIRSQTFEKKPFEEKTVLKDISGNGASFITRKKECYYLGQHMDIKIFMPQVTDINAFMTGSGTVVRIGNPSINANLKGEKQQATIAITLDRPVLLQRKDPRK